MFLEITLDALKQNNITAHQFLILKLLHSKELTKLEEYLATTNSNKSLGDDLKYLSKLGYLNYNSDCPDKLQQIRTSPLFEKIFIGNDLFEQLLNAYPAKVYRTNGQVDYLRTDRAGARRLYTFIVGDNIAKHEFILKCLMLEVKNRERNGSLKFMKRLPSWLSSREWESYADRIDDSTGVRTEDLEYGTNIE
jgi:hypothetical protein